MDSKAPIEIAPPKRVQVAEKPDCTLVRIPIAGNKQIPRYLIVMALFGYNIYKQASRSDFDFIFIFNVALATYITYRFMFSMFSKISIRVYEGRFTVTNGLIRPKEFHFHQLKDIVNWTSEHGLIIKRKRYNIVLELLNGKRKPLISNGEKEHIDYASYVLQKNMIDYLKKSGSNLHDI